MIIDGQQRLTTLSLLLIALRDYAEKHPEDGTINARRIDNMLLKNEYEDGDERYKLLLTETDRDLLISLVEKKPISDPGLSRILPNYNFFASKIADMELQPKDVYEAIGKLQIVNITLDRNVDDAQAIFESLNSTGKELSESDLIRNYVLMGLEAYEQLPEKPTHIFLQAGVGSLAGAITGLFSSLYGDEKPIIGIVEPDQADCLFRTAKADDGKLHPVTGHMRTIMAGLACGEPCSIGWQVLSDYADFFISCPDYAAAQGMRILGNPMGKDQKVVSGESGAAAFGAVSEILRNPELKELKEALKLNENSRILFFSTEGDTDKENYRRIVWDGLYAK